MSKFNRSRFKTGLLILVLVTANSACKKLEILPNMSQSAGSPAGMVCLNADPKNHLPNPLDHGEYNNLTFSDEFNGKAGSSDPAECYDDDRLAMCKYRLDSGEFGPCTQDVSHLKNLNKCRWTIWDGFSFWENSSKLAFKPSQIRVENGQFKINIKTRPSSEGPFQCGATQKNHDAIDYYDTNCPLLTGGIDSEFRKGTRTRGINIKEGRIEMSARFDRNAGTWPALWMWPASWKGNEGDPYVYQPTAGRNYAPETDILEASPDGSSVGAISQTYHTWGGTNGSFNLSPPLKDTLVYIEKWHTFGVERHAHEVRYYVDNCYTKIVKDGDYDKQWAKTVMVDPYASFVIMSMDIQSKAANETWSTLDHAEFDIDWVRMYER